MDKTIVVLGGSFNPPTKAHTALLKSAVEQLDASFGIFVPSSKAYVERKMSKQKSFAYSEEQRLSMLEAICKDNPTLRVDDCEYGDDGRGHTYDTLCKLQMKYPGYKLIFVIGADKLTIVPRWHNHETFFKNFEFAVTHRNDIDIDKTISNDATLAKYRSIFHEINVDDSLSDVSSTIARLYITKRNKKVLTDILEPSTMQFILRERQCH
ncbi:MAG: nicotinate (nicotinamide) nucleotide adenylyltransferase [Oscillospiraceae bacterium]|nr:nicotinate (nicotinamide) nucleotide adenylyltransferase [Oscillospiraceae bacterium]